MGKKRRKGNGGIYESKVKKVDASDIPQATRQIENYEYTIEIIEPPYEAKDLLRIVEESDIIPQLIDTMAVNIAKFGYGIRYREDFDYNKAEKSIQDEANKEWDKLNRIFKYVNLTQDFSKDLIYKMCKDRESLGYGALEILRNGKGEVAGIEYFRSCNLRMVKNENALCMVKQWIKDENGEYEQLDIPHKFKKFIQYVDNKKVYFKEFGDPRVMSKKTGEYRDDLDGSEHATEIAYFPIHCAYSEYGIPRWIGTLVNAQGNRLAELTNYNYFLNGRRIDKAIIVENGELTQSSIDTIEGKKGIVDNPNKMMVLEAMPTEETTVMDEKKLGVKVRVENLTDTNNGDALFQTYSNNNRLKIRDSFRIPPIYTGASTDYNKATSDTARQLAEEQIFMPERAAIASTFNTIVSNEQGFKYCEIYFKGPNISDIEKLAKALEPFITAGTVTPNMLIDALSSVLGKDIEPLPDEIGNKPFELVKMQYMSSNIDSNTINQNNKIEKSHEETINVLSDLMEDIKEYIGVDDE